MKGQVVFPRGKKTKPSKCFLSFGPGGRNPLKKLKVCTSKFNYFSLIEDCMLKKPVAVTE